MHKDDYEAEVEGVDMEFARIRDETLREARRHSRIVVYERTPLRALMSAMITMAAWTSAASISSAIGYDVGAYIATAMLVLFLLARLILFVARRDHVSAQDAADLIYMRHGVVGRENKTLRRIHRIEAL